MISRLVGLRGLMALRLEKKRAYVAVNVSIRKRNGNDYAVL